ncbi:MAG: D-Ala-D-Ala carboxypeptidase family metallohydrolase [Vicinamibacterales bacterium]
MRHSTWIALALIASAQSASAQQYSEYVSGHAAGDNTYNYYFTCAVTAYHNDDGGPLLIDIQLEAYDPDWNLLRSDRVTEGGGYVNFAIVATVPLAQLSSQDFHCRRIAFSPSMPNYTVAGKIGCVDDVDRNDVLREYGQYNVPWAPQCSEFTRSGGSAHFGWGEWSQDAGNHSYGPLALAKIWDQLENWRAEYNRGRMIMTSGYRCPHVNANTPGSAPDSRHQYGDAADVVSGDHPWTQGEFDLLNQAAIRAGSTFQEQWGIGSGRTTSHSHADWR